MVRDVSKDVVGLGDARFSSAVAALRLFAEQGSIAMPRDDLDFVLRDAVWPASDRNRAKRALEALCYGAIDILGLPRFPLPAEFIAAVIAAAVAPSNIMTACVVMSGSEWSDSTSVVRQKEVQPDVLFNFVLRILGGATHEIDAAQKRFEAQAGLKATAKAS